MKIIYYVHGTTYDNATKCASGWKDVELNDLGIEQAINLGKNTPYKFDVLFTSDLTRAMTSAKLAFPNFKSTFDSRLRECNYGDLDGKDKKLVNYEEHINEPFPNGESLLDVEKRIRDFLVYLRDNNVIRKYEDLFDTIFNFESLFKLSDIDILYIVKSDMPEIKLYE